MRWKALLRGTHIKALRLTSLLTLRLAALRLTVSQQMPSFFRKSSNDDPTCLFFFMLVLFHQFARIGLRDGLQESSSVSRAPKYVQGLQHAFVFVL